MWTVYLEVVYAISFWISDFNPLKLTFMEVAESERCTEFVLIIIPYRCTSFTLGWSSVSIAGHF